MMDYEGKREKRVLNEMNPERFGSELFFSKNFQQRLKRNFNITFGKDIEGGFCAYYDVKKKRILFGDVVGSGRRDEITNLSVESMKKVFKKYGYIMEEVEDIYQVLQLHLHPFSDSGPVPSYPDLLSATEPSRGKILSYPLHVIGSPVRKDFLHVLILQPARTKVFDPREEEKEESFNKAEYLDNIQDDDTDYNNFDALLHLAKEYNKTGYVVCDAFQFKETEDGSFLPSLPQKKFLARLKKFSYQPKLLRL